MHPVIKQAILALLPPLRQIVSQRNELLSAAAAKFQADSSDECSTWRKHRPYVTLNLDPAISTGSSVDDKRIVERLLKAYQRASQGQYGKDSMWRKFFKTYQEEHHNVFMRGDIAKACEVLANPATNNMFYGFDELCTVFVEKTHFDKMDMALICQDNLIRLAEAIGAYQLENPEGGGWRKYLEVQTDEVLRAIENNLGVEISFPNIYFGEVGPHSYRGLISYRAVQALYLAFRLRKTLQDGLSSSSAQNSICEIGGGLGRGALFARQLGLKDYTLVDVPMTTISQGYYLMRSLGEDAVVLPGEQRLNRDQIRLMHSEDFFASEERFDLIANVDSITEFGHDTAIRYLKKISEIAPAFLSINHEVNEIRMTNLLKELGKKHTISRYPYWMRNGYAEEFIRFLK